MIHEMRYTRFVRWGTHDSWDEVHMIREMRYTWFTRWGTHDSGEVHMIQEMRYTWFRRWGTYQQSVGPAHDAQSQPRAAFLYLYGGLATWNDWTRFGVGGLLLPGLRRVRVRGRFPWKHHIQTTLTTTVQENLFLSIKYHNAYESWMSFIKAWLRWKSLKNNNSQESPNCSWLKIFFSPEADWKKDFSPGADWET